MNRSPYWLTAAVLAVTFFAQALGMPARAGPSNVGLAARYGAQFGALASAGASLGAPAPGTLKAAPAAIDPAVASDAPQSAAPSPPDAPAPAAEAVPDDTPAPTPTPSPVPNKGKLIVIDAGHGGRDAGAVHSSGGVVDLTEEEVNLWVALRLAELLRQDGYDVHLTRTDDRALSPRSKPADLQARVDVANRAGADVFISVHHNGLENRSVRGTEVYYCSHRSFGAENSRLALLTQQALVRNLRQAGYDTVDRGAKDDAFLGHLALLAPRNLARHSRAPAIIGEALFMSNDQDAAMLMRADIREAIARGFFEGVRAYFGDTQ